MMKKILLSFFMFSLLTILINCGSFKTENTQIQRQWMLISFKNYSKQTLVSSKAEINLNTKSDNGNAKKTAFLGCNIIQFDVRFKKNQELNVSNLLKSKIFCQNNTLEDDFIKYFINDLQYSIQGHFLTLKNKNGEEMKLVAADWD